MKGDDDDKARERERARYDKETARFFRELRTYGFPGRRSWTSGAYQRCWRCKAFEMTDGVCCACGAMARDDASKPR